MTTCFGFLRELAVLVVWLRARLKVVTCIMLFKQDIEGQMYSFVVDSLYILYRCL